MIFRKLYVLPIVVPILVLGCFIITYIVSVSLEHVRPLFPYVSDTGTTPPESTIFAQALDFAAVFIYAVFYIRCKEVKILYGDPALPHHAKVMLMNRISLWISLPIAIGATMVGNFQETNALIPHAIGAFLCFVVGLVYFWLHASISYLTSPTMCTMSMAKVRLFITLVSTVGCGTTGIFAVLSVMQYKRSLSDIPKWSPEDGGYELHVVSTVSEWATLLFFGMYVLTFAKEFKDLALQSPQLKKIDSATAAEFGANSVTINSLDNMDRRGGGDNKGNGVTTDLGTGGSKTLLV